LSAPSRGQVVFRWDPEGGGGCGRGARAQSLPGWVSGQLPQGRRGRPLRPPALVAHFVSPLTGAGPRGALVDLAPPSTARGSAFERLRTSKGRRNRVFKGARGPLRLLVRVGLVGAPTKERRRSPVRFPARHGPRPPGSPPATAPRSSRFDPHPRNTLPIPFHTLPRFNVEKAFPVVSEVGPEVPRCGQRPPSRRPPGQLRPPVSAVSHHHGRPAVERISPSRG